MVKEKKSKTSSMPFFCYICWKMFRDDGNIYNKDKYKVWIVRESFKLGKNTTEQAYSNRRLLKKIEDRLISRD